MSRLQSRFLGRWAFLLLAIVGLYGLLLLPTLARQGISWDEQTDLAITQAYFARPGGWLLGSEIDPSQGRLPMAVVAAVYRLFGTGTDLLAARWVSACTGLLALLLTYRYAARRFSRGAGLLASALLATSPFYLSFARVAFTESDIYLACAFAGLLLALDRLRERQTVGRAAWVGLALGLAISAKATALAALPVAWLVVLPGDRSSAGSRSRAGGEALVGAVLAVLLLGAALAWSRGLPESAGFAPRLLPYLLALGGWLALLGWAVYRRAAAAAALPLGGFLMGLALLTAFVVPPEHLGNPRILDGLVFRAENEMRWSPGFVFEAGALHVLCILLKSSPLVGAGMLFAWAAALADIRREATRPAAWLILAYLGGLLLLPLAQTFYTVPLLPALAVLAADGFLRLYRRARLGALGLAALAALLLVVDLVQCYPDYNINGYQWVGARQLAGRPSIGYRSVVQTPSDGVEQAFRWLNTHARAGETVRFYVLEWHIIQAVAPSPVYRLENGFEARAGSMPDYVVVAINTQIPQSWWTAGQSEAVFRPPYDPAWLESGYRKVFTVPRAFGIEMASVWQKR